MKYIAHVEIETEDLMRLTENFKVVKLTTDNHLKINKILSKLEQPLQNRFGFGIDRLKEKGQSLNITPPREMVAYIIQIETDLKYQELAKLFNKKSHATAINMIKNAKKFLQNDKQYQKDFVYLYKNIRNEEFIKQFVGNRS